MEFQELILNLNLFDGTEINGAGPDISEEKVTS